jgi:exonuclease SbcC
LKAFTDKDGSDLLEVCTTRLSEQEVLKADLTVVLKKMEKEKNRREADFQNMKADMDKYSNKYMEYKTKKTELESLRNTYSGQKARSESLQRELTELKGDGEKQKKLEPSEKRYHELYNEREKLAAVQEAHNKKAGLVQQLKTIGSRAAKSRELSGALEDELEKYSGLDARIKKAETERQDLDSMLEELNDNLSRSRQNIAIQKRSLAESTEHQKAVKDLGPDSTCPTCERPLEEHYDFLLGKLDKELSSKKSEISAMENTLKAGEKEKSVHQTRKNDINTRLKELEKERRKRDEKKHQFESEEKNIKTFELDTAELNKKISELGEVSFDPDHFDKLKQRLDELKQVHEQYIALSRAISRIPNVKKTLEGHKKELDLTAEKIKEIEGALESLGFDEVEYERLRRELDRLRNEHFKSVSEFEKKNSDLELVMEKIKELEKQKSYQEELRVQEKEYKEKLNYLSTLADIMKAFKQSLISRIRPLLAQYSSEYLSKLTEGRYSELELDEDYEIFIFDNGDKFGLKRFSGGEEDIANLSLRLAMSRVIAESAGTTGINMIILDEIFGSQDLYRKRNIISVLNELSNQYQQIFLITHIDEMKEHMGFVLDVHADPENEISVIDVIN